MMNLRSDKQIIIGHYPIRNDYIVWNYVDKSEDASTAYFLSNEGIAVKPFMKLANGQDANKLKNCYYISSDLQKWLNGEFLEEYFNPEERKRIKSVSIPTINNIVNWFPLEEYRVCMPSPMAKENGASVYSSYNDLETCVYWLADTGRKAGMSATVVLADGKIYKSAYLATTNVCVRPVLEIIGGETQWD